MLPQWSILRSVRICKSALAMLMGTTFDAKWVNLKNIMNKLKKAQRKEQRGLQEKGKLHKKGQGSSSKKLKPITEELQLLLKD